LTAHHSWSVSTVAKLLLKHDKPVPRYHQLPHRRQLPHRVERQSWQPELGEDPARTTISLYVHIPF